MSPEFRRNLWLEFTPSRVAIMTSIIALVGLAVFLISRNHVGPLVPLGIAGYLFITLFWGARNAARSVIGEIRERTWDFQRISAAPPASMALGKLFGATSYTWYGGLLSLSLAIPGLVRTNDVERVIAIVALLVASGLLCHAVSLGSALATARRRRTDARLGVLPHQAAGLIAAFGSAGTAASMGRTWYGVDKWQIVHWFGGDYTLLSFVLVVTLVFAGWAIVGCWREMRLELMETNTPVVWPAFLGFLAVLLAGFGENTGQSLALAYAGIHAAAMIALIVEPKNAVDLRAFGSAVAHGQVLRALARMPAYAWAFVVAAGLAIALVAYAPVITLRDEFVTAGSALGALGFLARDIGVFHFFHAKPRQNRGDFSGLVSLALLYVLGGAVANSVDGEIVAAFVRPSADIPAWLAVAPWMEALVVWVLAVGRFRGHRPEATAAPASA